MYEGGKFESAPPRSVERDQVLIDELHATFEKQRAIYQPNPKNFIGDSRFNDVEIQREIELARSLEEKWEKHNIGIETQNKKISDVFEGIIVDQFCGEWLANQAEAFFTAPPDDYLRKVDCVIEFHPEEGMQDRDYLGLGIDVTFSSDYSTVTNKLSEVWNDVVRSKKVQVKYVDTENYKGSLDVCRVVLAADKETVLELAQLYKQKDLEKLNNHPYLANIISQIKCQLESFFSFAQKKRAKAEYLQHLARTLKTFYRVLDAKESIVTEHADAVEQSRVYQMIREYCKDRLGETEIKYAH